MSNVFFPVVVAFLWLGLPPSVAAQSALERARILYNAGSLDAAIQAAASERSKPATASSAALIIARARLERFSQTASPEDLDSARQELASLNPLDLSRHEMIEWQIGLGQTLYLENEIGPASEWFRALIPSARAQLPPPEADKLLEWWAATTSKLAESLAGNLREEQHREVLTMMEEELQRDPSSRAATYWIVVASRGVGDLNRAWNTAVAGWIRAKGVARPQELRAELEQFVLYTIVPERAQLRTGQRLDNRETLAEINAMTEEWRKLTSRWDGDD
jgi:hypothetical protein